MKKDDFELGMFVSVMKNVNTLAKSRLKVRRLGEVVGIYDTFVNLILFDSDIETRTDNDNDNDLPIIVYRKLYSETFEFHKVSKVKNKVEFKGEKHYEK